MNSENKATKREQILNHAISQFNAQGYYDTRLEDIARASGTGATNISYHFKSKEALLEEAYGLACNFSDAEILVALFLMFFIGCLGGSLLSRKWKETEL